MKFIIDHDYHIHSQLSLCSNDPLQKPRAILEYAQKNHLKNIVLTDHFWDETVPGASSWYQKQDYAHITAALPLPQADGVHFYFGCETDLDRFCTVGVSKARMDSLDFIIIPTTHLHMDGFTIEENEQSLERRAFLCIDRLNRVLDMDLPFHKIGIAHLTCSLIFAKEWQYHLQVLNLITDDQWVGAFRKAKEVGVGIELNFTPAEYQGKDLEDVLRPYRLAKECGCKFYLGSDAHGLASLEKASARFNDMVNLLDLQEEDKFRPFG